MTGSDAEPQILAIGPHDPRPDALPILDDLFEEAQKAGWAVTVTAEPLASRKSRIRAKRRHDHKASLRTIQLLVRSLREGYRFDDPMAQAKIEAIARALVVLEKEAVLLDRILALD